MSKKLLTLRELSDYLGLSEEVIISLVEERVTSAYKIGGELLRFRKEQIDATRSAIESRLKEEGGVEEQPVEQKSNTERLKEIRDNMKGDSFIERLLDFFYFYDFYIVAGVVLLLLVKIIFSG